MNIPNRKPAGRCRRIGAAQAAANRRIASQKATKGPHPHTFSGLPSLQKCVCEIFGDIWFEIRVEIWNLRWEKSGESWGEDLSTCQESTGKFREIFGANFGENLGNFVSNFATFFGNFAQQKGGCNTFGLNKKITRFTKDQFSVLPFLVCWDFLVFPLRGIPCVFFCRFSLLFQGISVAR